MNPPPPRRPAPTSFVDQLIETATPLVSWAWGKLRVKAAHAAESIESGDANRALDTAIRRFRNARAWARAHDTVPPGTVEAAQRRYEERVQDGDLRRERRERAREEKEAVRKEREQRYSEKSSIYME